MADQTHQSVISRRALVALSPAADRSSGRRSIPVPQAAFLAQLIACRDRIGPCRRYRQLEPKAGTARYAAAGATAAVMTAVVGRVA